jgi:hypothetical protein
LFLRASGKWHATVHLFAPNADTKALFALFTPLISRNGTLGKVAGVLGVALSAWQTASAVTLAMFTGIFIIGALAVDGHLASALLAVVATAALVVVVLALTSVLVLRRRWLPAWRDNGYAICTGNASPGAKPTAGQAEYEGLTPSMHGVIQRAAGRSPEDAPLTFGELWAAPRAGSDPAGAMGAPGPRAIELSMIASDISRNRTLQLPFIETPSLLYIERCVLQRYSRNASQAGCSSDAANSAKGWRSVPTWFACPSQSICRLSSLQGCR